MIDKKRLVIIIVIGVLLIGDVFFALNYYLTFQELQTAKIAESKTVLNAKVIDFTSMFVKDVLQANTEVDFNTRLSLENSVRNLNDPEILSEWQNFTNSKTEADAQSNVKILLGTLISKIQK